MSEREAFTRAICVSPADDTARLVFADWLEEHGERERAAFIRVQCELARLPDCLFADDQDGLRRDQTARAHSISCRACEGRRLALGLLQADEARALRWFGLPQPWAKIVRLNWFSRNYPRYPYAIATRGFMSRIFCDTAAFLQYAEVIFRTHPVTYVRLAWRSPDWDATTVPSWSWWHNTGPTAHGLPNRYLGDVSSLPTELFELLPGDVVIDMGEERKTYLTEEECWEALLFACVAYGRKLAGLPELAPWKAAA